MTSPLIDTLLNYLKQEYGTDDKFKERVEAIQRTHSTVDYNITISITPSWQQPAETNFEEQFRGDFISMQTTYDEALVSNLIQHLVRRDIEVTKYFDQVINEDKFSDANTPTHPTVQ